MYTPRPDRFTYPLHGDAAEQAHRGESVFKPWMRAAFAAGLIGAFALGLLFTLAG